MIYRPFSSGNMSLWRIFVIYVGLIGIAPSKKLSPNIVLIISDDLGWSDVGFTAKHGYNISTPETPELDAIARQSITFDNLYVQSLCTPTRSSILTGRYPHRLGDLFTTSVILNEEEYLTGEHTTITEVNYNSKRVGQYF